MEAVCTDFVDDYFGYARDMRLNHWTERGVFYVLLGTVREWDDGRRVGRNWLDKGKQCAKPASITNLK
jgi:hypothetical protein